MKARVSFKEERCKGCGLCVSVCPRHILQLDGSRTNSKGYHPSTITDQAQCIACAQCARICPDSVITVEKNVEEA